MRFLLSKKNLQTTQLKLRQKLTRELLIYHLHGAAALKVGGGDPLYDNLSFTTDWAIFYLSIEISHSLNLELKETAMF